MIHLDTSVLVDALTGPRRSGPALRATIAAGERLGLSALVLYEWLRGPRSAREIADQESLFPLEMAVPFGPKEAALAAWLYRHVARARPREFDLCLAACALAAGARLWTLSPRDFADLPDLTLYEPEDAR